MGRQLVALRSIEQLLPAVEIDRCQNLGHRPALSLVEIKHNTTASNGSARQLRPTPATGETTLPRHFAYVRKRGWSSRDLPQQATGEERMDSFEGLGFDCGSPQKAHDVVSVTALKASPPTTSADNEHNWNQQQRGQKDHREDPYRRSNQWAV
jgi:hypothetical protein